MRRIDRLVVLALATAFVGLDIAEIAAQVPPSPAEPFVFAALGVPTYLPWIKMCGQEQGKDTCHTRSDGRIRDGATTVSIMLFEQPGSSEKILRITLPHNLMIEQGTRVMVDSEDPMHGSFVSCTALGCVVDYTVSDEVIGRMKNGRYLSVQAIHVRGMTVSWMVPIADFGKAYDGPPADLAKFKSIYESAPKPWLDDALQPHLRPTH